MTTIHHSVDLVADPDRLEALAAYAILDTAPEEGFDDIVRLAMRACATPIALVSLVAGDRQWFKARVGFPSCQTDLDASVCAHALAEPDLLVIPDLATDPRTARNPLVTNGPRIRFYAGAPLRTGAGHVLGSLCVIDHDPRPSGLAEDQAEALRLLARQVMSQLELRRLLREREELIAAQREGAEALLRQTRLLRTVTDNVGQAVFQMDRVGLVTFANPAAETMFGWTLAEMLGRDLHALIHPSRTNGTPFSAGECPLRRALVDGRQQRDGSIVFFRRDGDAVEASVTTAPIFAGDAVAGAVLTVEDVSERNAAEARLAASEAYWRGLFERLREGIVMGEVVRDAAGAVVDWRYKEVNPAFADLVGFAPEATVGRTVRELIPGIEEEWISDVGRVADTGEGSTFTRQVGPLGRWYEGRIASIGRDTFVILFLDVTARVRADLALAAGNRRREALMHLGDELRGLRDTEAMAAAVAASVGTILYADLAAYAPVDADEETITVGRVWSAPGISVSVLGRHAFRDFGSYVDDLKAGRTVVIADVALDPRTRERRAAFAELGVAALINVPIVEHDRLVAVVLALFGAPRALDHGEEVFVRTAADRARAGIARVRADERQAILNGEISHRLKNTLSIVQAIANQTFKATQDREASEAFTKRLVALGAAQDVLLRGDWAAADLREVVDRVLDTAGLSGRYTADGPAVRMGPRAALSTSLLLHELATNAGKYGALTVPEGHVEVAWRIDGDGDAPHLALDWREHGGPPAAEPTRKGFGSRLLRMGLVGTGGSTVAYEQQGLRATFRAPLRQVEQA